MTVAVEVVFAHWIEHGEGMTVAEVSKAIDVNVSTLRRHAGEHGGCPKGCVFTTVRRASYSKNYVGTTVADRNVDAWEPSGAYIRERFKQMQAKPAIGVQLARMADADESERYKLSGDRRSHVRCIELTARIGAVRQIQRMISGEPEPSETGERKVVVIKGATS
jgi:hypothetical protein